MNDWMNSLYALVPLAVAALTKIALAIVLWLVGQWLIGVAVKLVRKALERAKVDSTLIQYAASFLWVVLRVVLIIAILGYFGIETTTFAALFAAIGIAIGAAWGGLLANLAAGAFLIFLKPFKVGDFISAGEVIGTVREIGMFVTTIDTMDNVKTFIGNNKLFSGNIQNFTANPYRRVDLKAQLSHDTDHNDAIARLKAALATIPNVTATPAPDVEILDFTMAGPVLAVRPYCHNDNYWQVYFDTNKLIREVCGEAGYSIPEQHYAIRKTSYV